MTRDYEYYLWEPLPSRPARLMRYTTLVELVEVLEAEGGWTPNEAADRGFHLGDMGFTKISPESAAKFEAEFRLGDSQKAS